MIQVKHYDFPFVLSPLLCAENLLKKSIKVIYIQGVTLIFVLNFIDANLRFQYVSKVRNNIASLKILVANEFDIKL